MVLEDVKKFIQNTKLKSSIQLKRLQKLCEQCEDFNSLKPLLDAGHNYKDIKAILNLNLELKPINCPGCGLLLHAYETQTYPKTCKKCSAKFCQEKRELTNLKKYGFKNPSLNNEVKEKRESTMFKKFGSSSYMGTETFSQKSKETLKEKYGVENIASSEIIKDKKKRTCLEKFGETTYTKTKESKDKSSKFQLDKSYKKLFTYDSFEPLFPRDEWFGHGTLATGKLYNWKCKHCGNTFIDYINGINKPKCPKCDAKREAYKENEVRKFIKEIYGGKVLKTRKILKGKEIDIYLPELKIGFEFNGTYWHSVEFGKDSTYHLNKTIECEKLGIRLFHIWESDWVFKNVETKQKIKNVLNRVYDCENIIDRSWPNFNQSLKIKKIEEPVLREDLFGYHFYDCGKLIL